ncbi:MAG: glutamate formimidoyltransferase [Acidobacteriia bacterium]|nr:glutamate formimidoyltransferase [Terriglobia bacterium]
MQTVIECVPNFSEGREAAKVEAIIQALLAGPEVYLLDKELDADHNRSVITIVGTRESVGEAALRGIGKAAELIDLTRHQGAHPRVGATDVVPFVPISGVTLDDCVRIAEWVAEETWRRFKIPTYLYEAAARKPERRNLENIRKGQFEGLREEVATNPERRPDFGEAALHPTAGATVIGARKFLIAYNVNLNTSDVSVAKAIAKKIRASSGGFPCVKAMGVELKARNLAQVSMNLTDFDTTSVATVFVAIAREATAQGVGIKGSEIVGLIPRRALEAAAVQYLKVGNYQPTMIFENRLAQIIAEQMSAQPAPKPAPLRALAEGFVAAVAAPTATPGGGSVAALAGALAASLGEMVCGLTLRRKSFEAHHAAVQGTRARLAELRERLLAQIDRDAQSYETVMAAFKSPKGSEAEQAVRAKAIESASKAAASVPLETAELAAEVARLIEPLRPITIPQAASDLTVAAHLAEAALAGAVENVRANLPSIQDSVWVSQLETQIQAFTSAGQG